MWKLRSMGKGVLRGRRPSCEEEETEWNTKRTRNVQKKCT